MVATYLLRVYEVSALDRRSRRLRVEASVVSQRFFSPELSVTKTNEKSTSLNSIILLWLQNKAESPGLWPSIVPYLSVQILAS